jgi:hypothetical protein
MTTSDGGGLVLDSAQDTFEGTMPYQDQVTPPVPGLVQWAYSLVVQSLEGEAAFEVTLSDPQGEKVAVAQAIEGVASIEGELRQQNYDLHIAGQKPMPFRAICTQTYGYRQ